MTPRLINFYTSKARDTFLLCYSIAHDDYRSKIFLRPPIGRTNFSYQRRSPPFRRADRYFASPNYRERKCSLPFFDDYTWIDNDSDSIESVEDACEAIPSDADGHYLRLTLRAMEAALICRYRYAYRYGAHQMHRLALRARHSTG
jgi:hypothetical protein